MEVKVQSSIFHTQKSKEISIKILENLSEHFWKGQNYLKGIYKQHTWQKTKAHMTNLRFKKFNKK